MGCRGNPGEVRSLLQKWVGEEKKTGQGPELRSHELQHAKYLEAALQHHVCRATGGERRGERERERKGRRTAQKTKEETKKRVREKCASPF